MQVNSIGAASRSVVETEVWTDGATRPRQAFPLAEAPQDALASALLQLLLLQVPQREKDLGPGRSLLTTLGSTDSALGKLSARHSEPIGNEKPKPVLQNQARKQEPVTVIDRTPPAQPKQAEAMGQVAPSGGSAATPAKVSDDEVVYYGKGFAEEMFDRTRGAVVKSYKSRDQEGLTALTLMAIVQAPLGGTAKGLRLAMNAYNGYVKPDAGDTQIYAKPFFNYEGWDHFNDHVDNGLDYLHSTARPNNSRELWADSLGYASTPFRLTGDTVVGTWKLWGSVQESALRGTLVEDAKSLYQPFADLRPNIVRLSCGGVFPDSTMGTKTFAGLNSRFVIGNDLFGLYTDIKPAPGGSIEGHFVGHRYGWGDEANRPWLTNEFLVLKMQKSLLKEPVPIFNTGTTLVVRPGVIANETLGGGPLPMINLDISLAKLKRLEKLKLPETFKNSAVCTIELRVSEKAKPPEPMRPQELLDPITSEPTGLLFPDGFLPASLIANPPASPPQAGSSNGANQ